MEGGWLKNGGEAGRRVALLCLGAVVAMTVVAWLPLAALPFTGEDYQLLARIELGEPAYPHVFRPLPGLWLAGLNGLFGETAAPYHAASIGLHVVNLCLVYLLVCGLGLGRLVGLAAALLFGVGAEACDAVAWIAAVNRPLSAVGALVALNGLARWDSRAGWVLVTSGLAWQFFANEEFYGTAGVAAVWLALAAWRGVRRTPALAVAAGVIAAALLHYLFLQRVPGGADNVLAAGLGGAPRAALTRSGAVFAGWGLPAWLGWAPPVFAGLIALAGERRAAGLAILAWLGAFVPFALDDPVAYRAYPSLAPTAVLLSAGVFAARSLLPERRVELGLFAVLVLLALWGWRARRARLDLWRAGGREMAACVESLDVRAPSSCPVLVNLETSTVGLFVYRYGVGVEAVRAVSFLDGMTAHVAPRELPPAPWFGLRRDGSYGVIEPVAYLAQTPAIEGVRLYGEARTVDSLDACRELLAGPGVDLTRTALVETEDLGELDGRGEVVVLEPLSGNPAEITARMVVGVRCEGRALLALQEPWLYSHMLRVSPDQLLFSNVEEARVVRCEVTLDGETEPRPAFFLNAFGFGVVVPPGEHRVEVSWRRAEPGELR